MRPKIRYLHQEQWKVKSKSISNPSSWHWLLKNSERCHKLEATRCHISQRITRRWIRKLPTGSTCQTSEKWTVLHCQWMCSGWKQFFSLMQRRLRTKAGTFGDWSTSAVTTTRKFKVLGDISRGIAWYARQFVHSETDHQNLEAASSQQSTNCGSSTPKCREIQKTTNSQNSRLQAVLNVHVKIGPVTGIEVFKYAWTVVIEVLVPSQHRGNPKDSCHQWFC